jgi:CheY-like chemotaxis protein
MAQKCVLVVDDDEDSRLICRELLSHHGYRVVEADNGEDGIELALAHSPDLVLVDMRLPQCDGIEVVRKLRSGESGRPPQVVLFTADVMATRLCLESEGIAGLLIKPCPTLRMLQEVERLIGPAQLDGDGSKR